MGLFSPAQMEQINAVAAKSKEVLKPVQAQGSVASRQHEIEKSSQEVLEYFGDSPAILITSRAQLHEYVLKAIESGYCGIDTETTGLDRIKDTIVGFSLYYPGGVECYIPCKHIVPIFETPYKNQMSYEDVGAELQLFVEAKTKMIFANADFDLAFIYKDFGVDMIPICYYDVILAWRCLKENEKKNGLKELYAKYVMGGKGNPKRFSDFFSAKNFPYSKPEIAKLYAANDAKITFELFKWQLPYVTKSHPKCQKHRLEKIADLIWNIEFPMIRVCALMHRLGVYFDRDTSSVLKSRYHVKLDKESAKLTEMIQEVMSNADAITVSKAPFKSAKDFNPSSTPQVKYLLADLMKLDVDSSDKSILKKLNLPITNQLLKVRSLGTLIGSFVDKLPDATGADGRVHSTFKSIGADCIVGSSLLLTDRGYRTIKSIFAGDEPNGDYSKADVNIVNINKEYETSSHKVVYYNTPTIKLNLRGGFSVEGTPNHPIICSAISRSDVQRTSTNRYHFADNVYFKQLSEIDLGDAVYIPVGYNLFPKEYVPTELVLKPKYQNSQVDCKIPEYFTEDFAELLGIYFADGSIHDSSGSFNIRISNKDSDVIERVKYLVRAVFDLDSTVCWNHTTYDTTFGTSRISDIKRLLGRGAQNKYVCDGILQSPKSVVCAFIRGTTLDSSYDSNRQRLAINYFRKDAAEFVHQALANMGILSGLTIQNSGRRSKEHYRLLISGEYYKQFLDTVGVVQSSKRDVREVYAHPRFVLNDGGFYAYVESIEYTVSDVYDLTVPNTHSFIANGMVNHNTGRMSSADPNVQNIPSHALDIRHQFRATPAMEKIDDCTETEQGIEVTLGSYDVVRLSDRTEKEVIDLVVGDIVILLNNNKEVNAVVKSISNMAPDTRLCFDVI